MPAAAAHVRRPRAPPFVEPQGYARHRPESTLLYQLVEQHYPAFREMRAMAGRSLPDYIEEEFDAYLKCGRLEEGFLRLRCEHCHAEKLVAFSCKKRGFCPSCGARRMAETAARALAWLCGGRREARLASPASPRRGKVGFCKCDAMRGPTPHFPALPAVSCALRCARPERARRRAPWRRTPARAPALGYLVEC